MRTTTNSDFLNDAELLGYIWAQVQIEFQRRLTSEFSAADEALSRQERLIASLPLGRVRADLEQTQRSLTEVLRACQS